MHTLLLLPWLLWPAPAASAPVSALAPAPREGRAVLERLDGERAVLPLEQLSVDALEGSVLISFEGFPPPPEPARPADERAELVLLGGDRVFGSVLGGDGDVLDFALDCASEARLELVIDRLRALRFPSRLDEGIRAGLEPAQEGDRLYWIRPGGLDRVDGTVEAFEEGGVRFDSVLGSKLFPWEEVGALYVEPFAEAEESLDGGRPVVVDLVDGGRLSGALVALSSTGARLEVAGAGTLALPLASLAEVVSADGSAVFLSTLEPVEELAGTPFGDELGMRWPHRMDRSVMGGPLESAGQRYARGIGVHAPSRLAFRLDGSFRALRGAVAIDDSVLLLPRTGSVVFRILLDGQAAWESPLVRGGADVVPFEVPLEGARELTLEVDMATHFHVADRANWLRTLLVRG